MLLSKWFARSSLILPLAAALLYVAHPIHTEVVANIKSRDEILAMLFGLLSLYYLWKYQKKMDKKYLVISLLSFAVALFSKESAITLLAVFPLSLYFFTKADLKQSLITSLWFLIPAIFFLAVRVAVIGGVTIDAISVLDNTIVGADGFGNQVATAFLFLGYYLKTLFMPYTLAHELGYPQIAPTTWADWRVWLSFLAYGGMFVYALLDWKKKSIPAFGILFFLITFSIGMNIFVRIGTSYAERLLYMPSFGL